MNEKITVLYTKKVIGICMKVSWLLFVFLIHIIFIQGVGAVPYISDPVHIGNYIQGVYSNNETALNLWESPNYVWGIYNFTDTNKTYYRTCVYSGNNVFSCDFVNGTNFTFQFQYSDVYYYANGTNFTSDILYFSTENAIIRFSRGTQEIKESTIKGSNLNLIGLLVLILIAIGYASFMTKDKVKYVRIK